ncbi:MAG: alpha-L-fucosidase [Ruminococcaceae bacterium]|nr:alpha-L-fucosidase [Oscillospiraceae bacterium]
MACKASEYLKLIDETIANGRYKADWSSLSGHKIPDWYYHAKFGIFIHWGIYSVPAYACEWYPRWMYNPTSHEYEFHKKNFGDPKTFGYKDFIPMFKGENFNAEEWVELFKRAGARYIMPVLEHHDGFAMYDTEFNRWNAAEMGPRKDIAGEIKRACEEKGLVFCASSHRAEHYFFMNMGRSIDSDVNDEEYRDFYGPAFLCPELSDVKVFDTIADTFSVPPTKEWMEDWLVRTCEIVDRYRPSILYFDTWIHNAAFKPYLKKLCAYYYDRADEWGKEVTINYKHESFPPDVATFDVERGALTGISPLPWQTDTAIGKKSWGYISDNEFKPARQIICDLIDIVSKNGMLLLNVGPKPDGSITDEETEVLEEIGNWMKVNGEGIYGTKPWKQFGEGKTNNEAGSFKDNDEKEFTPDDFRFTYKDGFLYAFCMKPQSKEFLIRSLKIKGSYDLVLGYVEALGDLTVTAISRDENGLKIVIDKAPATDKPVCFKISCL